MRRSRSRAPSAVYDPAHNLIFASNADWNRVDVLSNKTHQLVKSIPIPNPRGVDIRQDNATV
jgi:DNA-binding beta-propeller fold protein YncE